MRALCALPPDRVKHVRGLCFFMSRVEWWKGGGLLHSISYGSSFFGLGIFGKAEKAFFRGGLAPKNAQENPKAVNFRVCRRQSKGTAADGGGRRGRPRPNRRRTSRGGPSRATFHLSRVGGVARLEKSARADCNIAPGGAISALKRRRHEVFLSRRPPLEGASTKLLPPTLRAPPLSFEDAPTARHRNSGTKGALPPQGTRPCGLAAALRGRREAKQTSEVEQGGLAAALRFKAMWRGSFLYLT